MEEQDFQTLLLKAHHKGVECTLDDLRSFEDFSGLSLMQAITEIDNRIRAVGLCVQPPIDCGEVDDPRVIIPAKTIERYHRIFEEAVEADEGQEVEFKESLYVKKKVLGNTKVPKSNWVSEDIVFECIRAICAFLNADGGTLLIGVADSGQVQGLECEFELVKGGDGTIDKWELFFSDCLQKYIYDFSHCIGYVSRKVIQVDGHSVCVVSVRPRKTGISVCRSPDDSQAERVFVRNGNGSKEIRARGIAELVQSRFLDK